MNLYDKVIANSAEEYFKYLDGGHRNIACSDVFVSNSVFVQLEEMKDRSDLYELEYAKLLTTNDRSAKGYKKAFEITKRLFDKGYEPATNALGYYYWYGRGVEPDKDKAIELYKKASEKGSQVADFNLFLSYNDLKIFDDNYKLAFQYLEKSYQEGFWRAKLFVGCYLLSGEYYPQDVNKGLKILEPYMSEMKAIRYLSNLYYGDYGEEYIDYKKAFSFLSKLADNDYSEAMNRLGVLYKKGLGVNQSDEKAFEWFDKASKYGDMDAIANLATCYLEGCGVKKDETKAYNLYKKSAIEGGSTEGAYGLGECLYNGKGTNINFEEALYWYEDAAESGHIDGMYKAGKMYENGEGTKQLDYNKARKYYHLAMLSGHKDAEKAYNKLIKNKKIKFLPEIVANEGTYCELGDMYYDRGDYRNAVKYYLKAAEANEPLAGFNLGLAYQSGQGVPLDKEKSLYWYEKSAEHSSSARHRLGLCYLLGIGTKVDFEKARYWFEKSLDITDSLVNLGQIYYEGLGTKKDVEKAAEYFDRATSICPGISEDYICKHIDLRDAIYSRQNNEAIEEHLKKGDEYANAIERDYKKALEEYMTAAKYGSVTAMEHISSFYGNGYGVEKSAEKQFEWAHRAAKWGSLYGKRVMANALIRGEGIRQDVDEALKLYNELVEKGDFIAMYSLSFIYFEGKVVEKDLEKSFELLKQSADATCIYAYAPLGERYYYGLGVKQDYVEARKWFEKSGDNSAKYHLGLIYRFGYGVKKDIKTALEHLELGAAFGDTYCMCQVGEIYENGDGVKQDYSKAYEYYGQAASKNDPVGLYALANLYYYGLGCEKNLIISKGLFMKAEQLGDEDAARELKNRKF